MEQTPFSPGLGPKCPVFWVCFLFVLSHSKQPIIRTGLYISIPAKNYDEGPVSLLTGQPAHQTLNETKCREIINKHIMLDN